MLERDVADAFNNMFKEFGILAPINNSLAGWPDRIVQLINSRAIAVEIKAVKRLKNDDVRLVDFRKEQAAWLAKWQKNGGKCFLFIGISSFTDDFIGYGIITVSDWRDWIRMPNMLLCPADFDFISNEPNVILDWFKVYSEFSYA